MRKKFYFALLVIAMSFSILATPVLAFEWDSAFTSCCIGPRVGLEKNEGEEIQANEWVYCLGSFVPYVGPLIVAFAAYDIGGENGLRGFLASCCIGPRVGKELHYRKIRTVEWFSVIPFGSLITRGIVFFEAGQGKTMTEIAAEENLAR